MVMVVLPLGKLRKVQIADLDSGCIPFPVIAYFLDFDISKSIYRCTLWCFWKNLHLAQALLMSCLATTGSSNLRLLH